MKPAFARGFPADAALDALVAAFARGDYRTARGGALRLARETPDEAVRAAARELFARTRASKAMTALYITTALLVVTVSSYWLVVARGH